MRRRTKAAILAAALAAMPAMADAHGGPPGFGVDPGFGGGHGFGAARWLSLGGFDGWRRGPPFGHAWGFWEHHGFGHGHGHGHGGGDENPCSP